MTPKKGFMGDAVARDHALSFSAFARMRRFCRGGYLVTPITSRGDANHRLFSSS
jgi:hypothetical protein